MTIAIHQPNFLPWMGYFYKIAQSDTFVFLDDVEYTKKSYTKRVKIHKPGNLDTDKYITIPLQKHSDYALVSELRLLENTSWKKKIKAQIHQSYNKAPYYHQLAPILDVYFDKHINSESFSEFTSSLTMEVSRMLLLEPNWIYSHNLNQADNIGSRNISIVKQLNGDRYLSGLGAKKYQSEEEFIENSIELIYSDFPSKFNESGLPAHLLNKSIISHLAMLPKEQIQELLQV